MRRLLVPALLAASASLASCGSEASPPVDSLSIVPAAEDREHDFPDAGLTLSLPRNFSVVPSEPPGVFRASFGEGFVSAFAYRREEELPVGEPELERARARLVRAARERSPSFRPLESRTTRVAGEPAIELLGDQTISRARLRTRSFHVYAGEVEYVIELATPRRGFAGLDRRVSSTIRRTLTVTGEVRRSAGG